MLLATLPANQYTAAADLVINLAAELKTARLNRNLTATEAAKQIGVTTPTIIRLEAGLTEPSRNTIVRVLRWLAL